MKIKLEMDITTEEFQELFVPGDKQQEFQLKLYNAYSEALQKFMWDQVDPYKFVRYRDGDPDEK